MPVSELIQDGFGQSKWSSYKILSIYTWLHMCSRSSCWESVGLVAFENKICTSSSFMSYKLNWAHHIIMMSSDSSWLFCEAQTRATDPLCVLQGCQIRCKVLKPVVAKATCTSCLALLTPFLGCWLQCLLATWIKYLSCCRTSSFVHSTHTRPKTNWK